MQKQNPTKGFLIVASYTINFYRFAINLAESIRDYYPEAKICLVTEKQYCDGRESVADDVIYCGGGYREKLWALSRTPYDITCYIDADAEIRHNDITKVFDQLKDNDMLFVDIKEKYSKIFKIVSWPGGKMKLFGGIVLYDIRNPLVKSFMEDWYKYYIKQRERTWWPDRHENGSPNYDLHPQDMAIWDQFTLWWLSEKNTDYKNLKIGIFDESERWNYYSSYDIHFNIEVEPIVYHLSCVANKGWNNKNE
tara:strand:- start:6132 stop:6884 length:753 start_codon:yes stop_codon:yes gene_type:complete